MASLPLGLASFTGTTDGLNAVLDWKTATEINKATFDLSQNYPNPFNPSTTIEFIVPGDGHATLKIFDSIDQEVATLFNDAAKAGEYHQTTFDGSTLASGMYFARLQFGEKSLVKKLLMVK